MDDQSRNLILATALSFLVILAWFVSGRSCSRTPSPPADRADGAGDGQTAQAEPADRRGAGGAGDRGRDGAGSSTAPGGGSRATRRWR